jgi:hypothetical protein
MPPAIKMVRPEELGSKALKTAIYMCVIPSQIFVPAVCFQKGRSI